MWLNDEFYLDIKRSDNMEANSYTITKYSLQELEWNDIWDIHAGLTMLIREREHKDKTYRLKEANLMLDEILRITDSKPRIEI